MTSNFSDSASLLQPLIRWWNASSVAVAVLTAVGFLAAAKAVCSALGFAHLYLKPSQLKRYLHPSRDGKQPWALVTGATDGIGKAFAHELAGRGFNVVVHGRNASKLASTVDELRAAHPDREFRSLRVDASRVPCVNCLGAGERQGESGVSAAVDFAGIVSSLADIHITVFVSNAGGALHPAYRTLNEIPQEEIAGNVAVNALFPAHLLAHLIPTLVRNSPALVLAIGSLSDNGLPLLSTYAASKSFLLTLTRIVAMDMRLQGHDVEVIGMRTGRVTATAYTKIKPTMFTPDATTFVRAALARVGCGRSEVVPYWGHALQQTWGVELMPGWVTQKIFLEVMTRLRDEEREELERERKGE